MSYQFFVVYSVQTSYLHPQCVHIVYVQVYAILVHYKMYHTMHISFTGVHWLPDQSG